MSVEPQSHHNHNMKDEDSQIELPRPAPSLEVYDVSSDEDYNLVSSTYKSKSVKKTTQTEGAEDDSSDSQDDDVTKELASSSYNVHTTKTEETKIQETSQEELINEKATEVNPISGEEKDAFSARSTQSQPPSSRKSVSPFYQAKLTGAGTQSESSSRKSASPMYQADTAEALSHAQRRTSVLSERNKPQSTQQQMRTTYSIYSNHDQEPILSVKLKLYHEGSHHQTNHVGVLVREDIGPSYYRREEDNSRRDVGDLVTKKRRRGQDIASQSYSDRSRQGDSRTRHDTSRARHETDDGNVCKELSAAAPIAFFIVAVILVYYCLMKNSEQPDTNKYKYRY